MNYGKNGVRKQEADLRNGTGRWGKKFAVLFVKVVLVLIVGAIVIGAGAVFGAFQGIVDSAPDIGNIDVTPSGFSTFVYDAEGNQIAKLVSTDSNRIPVSWDMIPENLAHAFVAIEDERFYDHNGIDIQGIIRAGYVAVTSRNFSEGASTITQQLLKNNVFTGWTEENTLAAKFKRKIQEQYLAVQLEKSMSKNDILLNYMNTINLGQNTLGVQAASLRYFNKSVTNLNLSECAVIAAITQNPSRFNPITHPEKNAERRSKVLNNMYKQGYISQTQRDEALADDVYSRIQVIDSEIVDDSINSYFVDALTDDVLEDLVEAGYTENQAYTLLYSGGLKIYSTQDPTIQGIADTVFQDESNYPADTTWLLDYAVTIQKANGEYANYSDELLETYFRQTDPTFDLTFSSKESAEEKIEEYKASLLEEGDKVYDEKYTLTPQPQVSLTIEDQKTGYIVAMEGGRGAKTASRTLNRATNAYRQPGSAFKVLAAYAPALDSAGYTLATTINDAPFNYTNGTPVRNWYKTGYRGLSSLRDGIRDSMNVVTVKLMTLITPQLGFDYLRDKFHFTSLVERQEINGKIFSDIQQTLCLGGITKGVTNIEINAAYSTIANGGVYIKPKLYTRILDHDGNVILDNTATNGEQVLKPTTAFLLTSAMKDVVTSGTGANVNFGGTDIAAKTGTTTNNIDVWLCGFTNYYTASVWAGYDNNEKLSDSKLAQRLWRGVMEKVHEDLPSAQFKVPEGITTATVCKDSGLLPTPGVCDGTLKTEYFEVGTVPTESCNVHIFQTICNYSGHLATDLCPFKVQQVMTVVPAEPDVLRQGSGTTGDPAAGQNPVLPVGDMCPHDANFFAQPNAQEILVQQNQELVNRLSQGGAAAPEAPPAEAPASIGEPSAEDPSVGLEAPQEETAPQETPPNP
ncbi:transglycosylase domain-containing protein [Butyrivibrio sp. MC2013]|uniref:transglycosylase domain-containing protein n=1 Tax=Butyrivibrio sp. MC2013 TaxID=1280686 RepID=UPI000407386F|nr:transglycosylase domain-containing protein [Butyrivibrio sp. MC2013]